jgi:hypothetical protein
VKRRIASFMAAAILAATSHSAGALTSLPAQPRAGQDFLLHFEGSLDCGISASTHAGVATVSGSTITVTYPTGNICGLIQPGLYVNAAVPGLAAGSYAVVEKSSSSGSTRNSGTITVLPSTAVTRVSTSLAGLWYVPEAPGWGINIAEGQSGQLFVTWFTYASGNDGALIGGPVWSFTSGGQWVTPTQFTGVLATSLATPFGKPFDPASFSAAPVGMSSITLTGPDTLAFAITLVHATVESTQTFNLTRYKF